MPERYLIPHIQNVRQLPNLCGPAALAAVLKYWGVEASQEVIANETFSHFRRSTHGSDLLLFARSIGLHAYSYRGRLSDLKQKANMNLPLIVLHRLVGVVPSSHYRIAVGYDDRAACVLLLDPSRPRLCRIPYPAFDRLWRFQNRWTLLVLPAERDQFAEELVTRDPVLHRDLAAAHLRRADYESARCEIDLAGEMWPRDPTIARMRVMIDRRARQARPAINAT